MDRNKRFILIGILILIIASMAAIRAVTNSYLPVSYSNSYFPDHTRNPCLYWPYPLPTEAICITPTSIPNPYPAPPTQTPWIIFVSATPRAQDKVIYLPVLIRLGIR